MSILITGGAGFIGSSLAEKLLNADENIIVLDNFDNYYDTQLKKQNISTLIGNSNYKIYTADILDNKSLDKIFEENKIDTVVHLAACVGVRNSFKNPAKYINTNIKGTINILKKIKKYNVEKIIFASSSSVYGNRREVKFKEDFTNLQPISPYAVTKITAEKIIYSFTKNSNLHAVCLRFFTVYGPRQRPDLAIRKFTDSIKNNTPLYIYGDGSTIRDYTYIDDVVSGICAAIKYEKTPYEIINIGGNNPIKLYDAVTTIEKVLNKKATIKHCPPQKGDVKKTAADITKARNLLNYNPQISFEHGIKNFIDWYYKN